MREDTLDRERQAALADLRPRGWRRVVRTAIAAFAVVGAILLIMGVTWSSSILRYQMSTVATTGLVTGVVPRYEDDGTAGGYSLFVRFEVVGRPYTIEVDQVESTELAPGSLVEVRYREGAPEQARLGGSRLWTEPRRIVVGEGAVSFRLNSDGPIPLLVCGLLGMTAGIWLVLGPGRKRRRAARAIRGLRLEATVIGVQRGNPDRRLPWKLTVENVDSATGVRERYVRIDSRAPEPVPTEGAAAVVFVDLSDSTNYVVIPPS